MFPTLWDKMDVLAEDRQLISSEEVLRELERKEGDTLHEWAKERHHIFVPLDDEIQNCAVRIMIDHPKLVDERKGKSFADPWVIATARINACIVVTGEIASGSRRRPKIPDVCRDMGIRCIRIVDLIREERWRF